MRDPRYDILFEPIKIGPVTAPNRFWQVPHCTGMGYRYPDAEARHRAVKAEGGWGVVSTQEVEIHHNADVTPFNEGRLWDDRDIPALARMAESVKAHGSLAAIELCHNGLASSNRFSRVPALSPSHSMTDGSDPIQARAMDKSDIRDMRRWFRDAALRSRKAGFDIIYVYAAHDLSILQHFLSRRHNTRSDEYGGSLENRVRLFREILEDTKDAVGDTCGIAVRFAVDELLGPDGITCEGEGRDTVEMLAELPDVWDVNISAWENDSQTARFAEEGFQEPYISFVKKVTTKPVLGVGRYTSPDSMVRVIKQGIMDIIGAARPSIADPHLPKKIEEGRIEDIRECIGCNICVTGDNMCVPMRCTQNPTTGEEWRRGWHPEDIEEADDSEQVLIVGGGPAGLEAARALGQRGVSVMLAEAGTELGGRVSTESLLPGLASWNRVRDWRLGQLAKYPHVETYLDSALTVDGILEYGIAHVVLATGAHWRADGVGRTLKKPVVGMADGPVVSVDAVLKDHSALDPSSGGPVVIYDDDGYYMGGVLAELAVARGHECILVTPASDVSYWTHNNLEQARIQSRLIELGVTIIQQKQISALTAGTLELACNFTGKTQKIDCGCLVPVTARVPDERLWLDLKARESDWADAGIKSVTRIGDCLLPGIIASAVHSGHLYAREFGEPDPGDELPFKREMITLESLT